MQYSSFKFKSHFKNLNYYSIPLSILFVVKKRFNLVFFFLTIINFLLFTII